MTIQKASFSRLDVKFNHHMSPPTAKADFMGYINFKDRRGEIPYENFAGRFVVDLRAGWRPLADDRLRHAGPAALKRPRTCKHSLKRLRLIAINA